MDMLLRITLMDQNMSKLRNISFSMKQIQILIFLYKYKFLFYILQILFYEESSVTIL